jgi:uncharacterized protein YndB with AHSA1/START domain
METQSKPVLTVACEIMAPIDKVWAYWTQPEHIKLWNTASDDWHTTKAENDLRVGGSFSSRMEAKDGSFGFDFGGVYDEVRVNEYIAYTLGDDRKVAVSFSSGANGTTVSENFEAENENPLEMQQGGWQAIMNNFKKYTEAN